jgi:hypothetical protein
MSGLALGRSVGSAFQHSETNSPAAWRTAADHQKATGPAADWWHGFGSSQLDELLVAAGSHLGIVKLGEESRHRRIPCADAVEYTFLLEVQARR